MCNGSRARSFYINLMNIHEGGKLNGNNDLVSRIRETCDKHDVSFFVGLIPLCLCDNCCIAYLCIWAYSLAAWLEINVLLTYLLLNMFLTKITPAMYGKTYCAFRKMA